MITIRITKNLKTTIILEPTVVTAAVVCPLIQNNLSLWLKRKIYKRLLLNSILDRLISSKKANKASKMNSITTMIIIRMMAMYTMKMRTNISIKPSKSSTKIVIAINSVKNLFILLNRITRIKKLRR